MSRTLAVALAALLLACAQAKPLPAPAPAPVPVSESENPAIPSQAEAEANCAASQPRCRFPYAIAIWPPHPCAHQGALCTDDQLVGYQQMGWGCGCDECRSAGDCPEGKACRAQPSCEGGRLPVQCLDANAPPPEPCPDLPDPP